MRKRKIENEQEILESVFGVEDQEDVENIPQESKKKKKLDIVFEELKKQEQQQRIRKGYSDLPKHREQNTWGHRLGTDNNNNNNSSSSSSSGGSGGGSGSINVEVEDAETTNLYIGNLPPDITEAVLLQEFGHFGPIASVKIMYPRKNEENSTSRIRYCGFVCFMERKDAERAKQKMNGTRLRGYELNICWGKKISLPSVPASSNSEGLLIKKISKTTSGIHVQFPSDPILQKKIDYMAMCVVNSVDGYLFERIIKTRERNNVSFSFLNPSDHHHIYYKWRVFSLLQGDTLTHYRREPFQMFSNEPMMFPPSINTIYSLPQTLLPPLSLSSSSSSPPPPPLLSSSSSHLSPSGREKKEEHANEQKLDNSDEEDESIMTGQQLLEKKRKQIHELSEKEREVFTNLLNEITPERKKVMDAMIFAMDHGNAISEIIEMIKGMLADEKTTLPQKVGVLYLINDLLSQHSTTQRIQDVSAKYQESILPRLRYIFRSLGDTYRFQCPGLIAQNWLKDRVFNVLKHLNQIPGIEHDLLLDLESTFLMPT